MLKERSIGDAKKQDEPKERRKIKIKERKGKVGETGTEIGGRISQEEREEKEEKEEKGANYARLENRRRKREESSRAWKHSLAWTDTAYP